VKTSRSSIRRVIWLSVTGTSALLLVAFLSMFLSRSQAVAQPVAEVDAVSVNKDVNVDWAAPGDVLTYTISIQESGSPVTLWMTDTLPEEVTYVDHSCIGPGDCGYADGVFTWTASSIGWGATAVITFSGEISSETAVAEIVNTARVTGTGGLITDSARTRIFSGQPPNSQIRSPDRDAFITQKGSLTVSGIAWGEGMEPPYLVDDPNLSAD